MAKPNTLERRKSAFKLSQRERNCRVVVCAGTGCMAGGAMKIVEQFRSILEQKDLLAFVSVELDTSELESRETDQNDFSGSGCEVAESGCQGFPLSDPKGASFSGSGCEVAESGCQGFCQMGPLVSVHPKGVLYVKVKPEDVEEIISETIEQNKYVERLLYTRPSDKEPVEEMCKIPFYERQKRLMLGLCGNIDVNRLDEYIANDGYFMARKAVLELSAQEVCSEVFASGLRGRGGGGFPTGRKWELTRVHESDVKYVICNGDEGDPGAFMDRCVMEGNPHALLEGMIIAAQAVHGTHGHIYVRMEYPLAVRRLRTAIQSARDAGFLGDNIFGSEKHFDIEVMEGAGAFVCGEETALMASVEGKRGMPTLKPPFPAEKGLFGKPTVINNVETLATVPLILRMGAAEYSKLGTESSRGTKTFALTGHVANTGLIEVPFGTTLREIVGNIGGGVMNDDGSLCGCDFKAVQIGGPSGGCLTQEHLDLPLDYDQLQKVGAMVGSGGLVVMNENTCMVQIARFFMQFTQNESCGKCVVCREGTRQMLVLLDDIISGKATEETLNLLEDLARMVKVGSLCGLGKTAPNPVLSTLRYFRDEYLAHVRDKRCPTGNCEALLSYLIIENKCKSCSLCARKCPVDAISGSKGVPYKIDQDKCIKCGACIASCKFGAIAKG